MVKILVVYYSRTGYTQRMAEAIGNACGADVERIRYDGARLGVWGYLRCGREALTKRAVDIEPAAKDPASYDLVVIGTPVWASNISSPVRAYLRRQKAKLRQVALFCTEGGSGGQKVLADMAELCGKQPMASLELTDREIVVAKAA
jgi:flavodoxin